MPAGIGAVSARVDADLRDLDGQRVRVRGGGQVALSAATFGYRITIANFDHLPGVGGAERCGSGAGR